MNVINLKLQPNLESMYSIKLSETLLSYHYTQETVFSVALALEEIFLNIVKYSECTSDIHLTVSLFTDNIKIGLADNGKKFNPLDYQAPDFKDIYKHNLSGLGIHLAINMVKDMCYYRVGVYNVLIMLFAAGNCRLVA
jgi:anti-sigma regulatory factor (Ser/Thr protein kinase)